MNLDERKLIIDKARALVRQHGLLGLDADLDRLHIELSFPEIFQQMGDRLRRQNTRYTLHVNRKGKRVRLHTTTCWNTLTRKRVKYSEWRGPYWSLDRAKDVMRSMPYKPNHDVCDKCLRHEMSDALADAALDYLRGATHLD